jgi:hypothetical protein
VGEVLVLVVDIVLVVGAEGAFTSFEQLVMKATQIRIGKIIFFIVLIFISKFTYFKVYQLFFNFQIKND